MYLQYLLGRLLEKMSLNVNPKEMVPDRLFRQTCNKVAGNL